MHRMRGQARRPALTASSGIGGFGSPGHLARRFFASLRPGGPDPAGEAWAINWLTSPEKGLWGRMSAPDRRHAIGVAHRVAALAGNRDGAGVERRLLAAALLHDTGKQASRLGTFARAAATLVAMTVGRAKAASWASTVEGRTLPGWRPRVALYLNHDRIGAEMLRAAGSDELVAAWAFEHHRTPGSWTIDRRLAEWLKAADDD